MYDVIREFEAECAVFESSGVATGNCDLDVDECASNPCRHGSFCSESTTNSSDTAPISVDSFSCACLAGFANGVCIYDFIDEVVSAHRPVVLPFNCFARPVRLTWCCTIATAGRNMHHSGRWDL